MTRQSHAPVIVLTRPAAQAERFAADLRAAGIANTIIRSPLLEPEYLQVRLPDADFRSVIFTSRSAVEALRRHPADLPKLAWCVGSGTAEAAATLGFETRAAGGDAESLLRLLVAEKPHAPLVHLHGEDTRGDLVNRLCKAGTETFSVMVYRQNLRPLTSEAVDALQGTRPVILPVFSPRTAQWLAQEIMRTGHSAPLHFAAISEAAAFPLRQFSAAHIIVASDPSAAAMSDATRDLILA